MHACMHACKDVFMHVCGTVRGRHKDIHYTHMCVYTYPHRQIPMHVHVFIKEREERVRGKGGREACTPTYIPIRTDILYTTYRHILHYTIYLPTCIHRCIRT